MNHDIPPSRHILLTGVPGCGKTTLLKRLARAVRELGVVGFYTEEIRLQGQRKGFRLVGLDGTRAILAHVDFAGKLRVGKYSVAVDQLEDFLNVQNLEQTTAPVVFIDEIGKMECLSGRFVGLVRHLFDSPKTIVATIALKGAGLIAEIKQRTDVALIKVHPGNRDRLVEQLAKELAVLRAS